MIARVLTLLKSRASLTCFRACFLPGRAKDLSAPRYKLTIRKTDLFHVIITFSSDITITTTATTTGERVDAVG